MFDLPEPLGPTTTVIPAGKSNRVASAKLLNPLSSSALSIKGDCHPIRSQEKSLEVAFKRCGLAAPLSQTLQENTRSNQHRFAEIPP